MKFPELYMNSSDPDESRIEKDFYISKYRPGIKKPKF